MAFGFSVGDFLAVLEIAKGVYDACKDGPAEYQELCSETKSMRYAIQSLSNDAKDPNSLLNRKGFNRKNELDEIIRNCTKAMKEMQALVDKHSRLKDDGHGRMLRIWDAYQVGSSDLNSLRGKMTFYTSMISMFLLSLEGSAIARIETKLDRIYARILRDDAIQAQQSSISVASTTSILSQIETHEDDVWAVLKTELLADNVSMAHIMANKDDIISYIKSLISDGMPTSAVGNQMGNVYTSHAESLKSFTSPSTSTGRISPGRLPLTIASGLIVASEERPTVILAPPLGAAGVKATLTKVQYGTFNNNPACLVGLELAFVSMQKPNLVAGHVFFGTTHDSQALGPRHQSIVRPEYLEGPAIEILEQRSVGFSLNAGVLGIGDIGDIGYSAGTSRLRSTVVPLWSMHGSVHDTGKEGARAVWNIISDPVHGQGLPPQVRVGLIVLHEDRPFMADFEAKASKKATWGMFVKNASSYGLVQVVFDPGEGQKEKVFTIKDLEDFVSETKYKAF